MFGSRKWVATDQRPPSIIAFTCVYTHRYRSNGHTLRVKIPVLCVTFACKLQQPGTEHSRRPVGITFVLFAGRRTMNDTVTVAVFIVAAWNSIVVDCYSLGQNTGPPPLSTLKQNCSLIIKGPIGVFNFNVTCITSYEWSPTKRRPDTARSRPDRWEPQSMQDSPDTISSLYRCRCLQTAEVKLQSHQNTLLNGIIIINK